MSNPVYINVDGLSSLLPLAFKAWDHFTRKEALALPANWQELDASGKADIIMAYLQESGRRETMGDLIGTLPDALRVGLSILSNVAGPSVAQNGAPLVSQPSGNTQPYRLAEPASNANGRGNGGNGGGPVAPPPAPAVR